MTARAGPTNHLDRLQHWLPVRAWFRYADARGRLLAAGIAYYGFVSLFPALALAVVVFGFALAGHPDLLEAVARSLNQLLPGMVKTADNPNGLVELSAPATVTLSITGIVALAVLIWGGLGWVGSMRDGIRIMFGAPRLPGRFVYDKVRDLCVFLLLGVSIVVSALLTLVAGDLGTWLAGQIGLGDESWVVTVGSLLVSLLVNAMIMALLLRGLSGVAVALRGIGSGALLGGAGLTLLELFGSTLIRWATRSPLFGSFVLVVGMLFWFNFLARLLLYTAAWSATRVAARPSPSELLEQVPAVAAGPLEDRHEAGVRRRRDPRASAPVAPGAATLTHRDQDRVTLAAGAVIGATAALTLGALGRGIARLLPRRQRS
ncbi:MAG: YihY/virulence factor BrkB family protein [Dermatophilaceae bacterium]